MSKKIERKDRHFKFETLQLHVGQESPDPVTDARAVPIYRHMDGRGRQHPYGHLSGAV